MAKAQIVLGECGGGIFNPSVNEFTPVYGSDNTSKTMTIDLTKKYLLTIADSISNEANGIVYLIDKGTKTCIYESESNIDNRLVTVSVSGTSLVATLSWTQRYFTVSLIEVG